MAQSSRVVPDRSEDPLEVNFRSESWFVIANASQYLKVIDEPATLPGKIRSGQPLRGIGMFGRLGYSPQRTNPIARHASIAVVGRGLMDARPIDSFGAALGYNGVSDDLKHTISTLTGDALDAKDEVNVELFYDFAITPAVRIIASYQHIWNPLLAQLEAQEDHAGAFFTRINVQW